MAKKEDYLDFKSSEGALEEGASIGNVHDFLKLKERILSQLREDMDAEMGADLGRNELVPAFIDDQEMAQSWLGAQKATKEMHLKSSLDPGEEKSLSWFGRFCNFLFRKMALSEILEWKRVLTKLLWDTYCMKVMYAVILKLTKEVHELKRGRGVPEVEEKRTFSIPLPDIGNYPKKFSIVSDVVEDMAQGMPQKVIESSFGNAWQSLYLETMSIENKEERQILSAFLFMSMLQFQCLTRNLRPFDDNVEEGGEA